MSGGRIAAFVSAARSLLVVQVVAALLAVGVTAWAFFEVRGLVAEREQLRARVTELEAQAAQPQQPIMPMPLGPDPTINQILPPDALVPEAVDPGLTTTPEPGNDVAPVDPAGTPGNSVNPQPPSRWPQRPPVTTQPPTTTPPRLDCAGADRANPRCRPVPERPPIQQVPDRLTPRGEPLAPQQPPTLTRPQPQRPQTTARPQTTPQLQFRPQQIRPQVQRPQTTTTRPQTTTHPQWPATTRPQLQPPSSTPPRGTIIA